jgi:hypothetical protein
MVAPGENIFGLSDRKFNSWSMDYTWSQWTSFSTPIVAWAIALLRSNKPWLKNTDIYEAIKKTWDDIDSINPNYKWKLWKFLNIKKLMEWWDKTSTVVSSWTIDKKAIAVFITIKAQVANYSATKKQATYKSIYAKLDALSKDPKNQNNISYFEGLKGLIEGEMKK